MSKSSKGKSPHSVTLFDAAELFLLATSYAPASKKNYGIFLRNTLAQYVSGDRHVDQITHSDLVRFIAFCEEGRGVSRRTLRHYTGHLRTFFAWCEAVGYISENPAAALLTPKYLTKPERVSGIPVEHLKTLLQHTEVMNPRNYAILIFMTVTGCRVTATSNLELSNLDLQQGCALVFEKGQRWVNYDFDAITVAALRKWLALRPDADHDYVWTAPGSKHPQLQASGIRKMLEDLCKKLKLPHYTPHQLRHSAGEILANNDHGELAVASALNHQNLQSARHYMPKRLSETRHLRREIEATLYPDRVGQKPVPYLRIVKRGSHS